MTPTHAAAVLRQLTDWRRGVDVDPPKPGEVFEAIDAAIAMLERLEAAEKECELWAVIRDGMITPGHLAVGESVPMVKNTSRLAAVERERDALRAKIEALERQEPVAEWIENRFDCYPQLVWADDYKAIIGTKLYALPGAKGE